jgi:ADP-heptose:LPS heptosyltransferase
VKILAIRFARLGDVILLLPALVSLKNELPDSELTLLTGHRCAPIAKLCPALDRVIAVDRVAMRDGPAARALLEMLSLIRRIRSSRYDIVIDFHSFRETNLLTWLSRAAVRIGMKRANAAYLQFCFNRPPVLEDKSLHVADMFRRVVDVMLESVSGLRPRNAVLDSKSVLVGFSPRSDPTIVLFVDAPVPERRWPAAGFAQVADFAIENLGAAVIVISGPENSELAMRVQKASRNADRLEIFTDLTLPALVGVIASAHLLVSNDTGPMHIGPAVGVPTLGLFSVGYPEHFRPIGGNDRFMRANPIEEIKASEVIRRVEEMWTIVGPNLRR